MRSASILVLVLLLGVFLAAAPALAESGDEAAPKANADAGTRSAPKPPTGPARAGSLRALGQRMQDIALRIAKVVEQAARDPDEALIEVYLRYSVKELKNRRRQVRAKDLVAIMVDPSNSPELREKARAVVQGGSLRGDIDLSPTNKKRGMTERAWFCRSEVIEHLKHDDKEARRLANTLLREWYRRVNTVPAILAYKVGDKKTWSRAHSAWNKELKKR
ncbi:MAG: hypothetical protein QNJ90_00075 [Planctomycetota bacterium]|nr:hypothetical protein [Planctomycetota bacterium]